MGRLGDNLGMSLEITEELIARQPPEAQAMIRMLLARLIELEAKLGVFSGHRSLIGMCKELHSHRDWLWTFVDEPGVEPTNNASERSLRHAVIGRKLSFGTQSERGSRFVERMLTAIETCRQQSRSAFGFLSATIQAHFSNQTPPRSGQRVNDYIQIVNHCLHCLILSGSDENRMPLL